MQLNLSHIISYPFYHFFQNTSFPFVQKILFCSFFPEKAETEVEFHGCSWALQCLLFHTRGAQRLNPLPSTHILHASNYLAANCLQIAHQKAVAQSGWHISVLYKFIFHKEYGIVTLCDIGLYLCWFLLPSRPKAWIPWFTLDPVLSKSMSSNWNEHIIQKPLVCDLTSILP